LKDQALTFNFADPKSRAFKFVAFMYRGDLLGRRLAPGTTGPVVNAVSPDGKSRPAFLGSAPLGWKGEQRALMLIGENVTDLTDEPGSHLTFAGGFDHEDRVNDLALSTSFLALSYPVTDFDALRDRIGTIDLPRTEG
jgi:hypothetical protein